MIDIDLEILLNSVDDFLRSIVKCSIDLRFTAPRNVHEKISREGDEQGGLRLRVNVDNHESVRSCSPGLRCCPERVGLCLILDEGPRVGAKYQVVTRFAWARREVESPDASNICNFRTHRNIDCEYPGNDYAESYSQCSYVPAQECLASTRRYSRERETLPSALRSTGPVAGSASCARSGIPLRIRLSAI